MTTITAKPLTRDRRPRFYLAYGSNLNIEQMKHRCPKAEPIGNTVLRDARLIFREVADVEYHKGSTVPCGVWRITPECERVLDRYEGVSGGLYRKEYIRIQIVENGKTIRGRALIYQMNRSWYAMPHEHYVGIIRKGYRDFQLDRDILEFAIDDTEAELSAEAEPVFL
jgi:gamma-glutamylcyclotransferase (GGCT)/AIG2-like uncharacterized protein YtfP